MIPTRAVRVLPALAALVAAACATGERPGGDVPTGTVVATTPSCNFGTIEQLVPTYFNAADRAAVLAQVKQMKIGFATGGAAGATPSGFGTLSLLAAAVVAPTPPAGTPANGSSFANAVLACMQVFPPNGFTFPIDFAPALDRTVVSLGQGAFTVRGRLGAFTAPDAPVFARDRFSAINKPPVDGSTWSSWFSGGAGDAAGLVFGYRIPFADRGPTAVGDGYEWGVVRSSNAPLSTFGVVAVCVANPAFSRRVQRATEITVLQPQQTPTSTPPIDAVIPGWSQVGDSPCPPGTAPTGARAQGAIAPAEATRPLDEPGEGRGGIGGSIGSLSPFGGVALGSLGLEFTLLPQQGSASQAVVRARVRAFDQERRGQPDVPLTLVIERLGPTGEPIGVERTATATTCVPPTPGTNTAIPNVPFCSTGVAIGNGEFVFRAFATSGSFRATVTSGFYPGFGPQTAVATFTITLP